MKNKISDLKIKNEGQDMEIGNRDYIGKKRYDSSSKDVTPSKFDKKEKFS